MTRYITVVSLAAALFSAGCTTPKQPISASSHIIDVPALGEDRTAELGETLVEKGVIYTYDAIRLENMVTAGDGILLKKLTLQPGLLKASLRDDQRIYFSTDKLAVYDAILGTQMQLGGLAISINDETNIRFHLNGVAMMTPKPKPIYTRTQVADTDRPSFRQELIYNGRTGNALKFLYREYSSDVLRAPFSQEIQYDLSEGTTIGFKGARIEVIEASNTKLRYRVISSFPGTP